MLSNWSEAAHMLPDIALTYLIHSTVILLVVRTVTRRLRSAAWSEHLWKCGLIIPFLTTAFQFAAGTGWEFSLLVEERAEVSPAGLSEASPSRPVASRDVKIPTGTLPSSSSVTDGQSPEAPTFAPMAVTDNEASASRPVTLRSTETRKAQGSADQVRLPTKSRSRWRVISGMIVLTGAGLLLLRLLTLRVITARWVRRQTKVATGILSDEVNSFVKRHRVRRVVQTRVGQSSEPFACGVCRWVIVMPHDCADRLTRSELRALIGHEIAHLVRRDPVWQWVGRILRSLGWFQPLNALAVSQISRAAEIRADDWALARGVRRIDLAKCLTTVAEWAVHRPALMAVSATGRSAISNRVERLLGSEPIESGNRPGKTAMAAVFAGGLLLGTILPKAVNSSGPRVPAPQSLRPSNASMLGVIAPTEKEAPRPIGSALRDVAADLQRVHQLLLHEDNPEVRRIATTLERRLRTLENTTGFRGPAIHTLSKGKER